MELGLLLQKLCILRGQFDPHQTVVGIGCDSRRLKKNELFVAIRGTGSDGNGYIQQAIQKGACAVVTEQLPPGVPGAEVPDAREALAQLSACFYGYPAQRLKLVAVTGTNGKSSVTWLLKQVLEELTGAGCGLLGTLENHLGGEILPAGRTTPNSDELHRLLAKMVENGCQYAVMEVSSHALVQKRVAGISFAVGAFTNLSRDHLDYHGTMERYCAAKASLFSQCERAVLNADDSRYLQMQKKAQGVLCYSAADEAELFARNVKLSPDRVEFTAVSAGKQAKVTVGVPGMFTVYNALCVLGICLQLDFSLEAAAEALKKARGVKGRAEVVPLPGRDYTVIIDYAHTPDAMENILTTLRSFCKGRLIALFGCGGDRDRGKRRAMGEISSRLADISILTSDNPRFEQPMAIIRDILQGVDPDANYKVLENRVQAIEYAMDIGKKDDIIVLLGKGHETYQEVGGRRFALDEREILRGNIWEPSQFGRLPNGAAEDTKKNMQT